MIERAGFGLAIAVLIDATIVRSVLVPPMEMLGEWNWYLPTWLSWLPKISVEGHARSEPVPARVPGSVPGLEFIGAGGD
jgi:RND superfamily putative drug exporter